MFPKTKAKTTVKLEVTVKKTKMQVRAKDQGGVSKRQKFAREDS